MAWVFEDRDNVVIHFLLFCKREIIFETIFWIARTQNQVLFFVLFTLVKTLLI